MMHVAPAIEMPKLPKGQSLAKHRPVTGEEFDRLVEAAAEFRPSDSAAWVRLLRGLWLSGLRLGEALALSWDAGAAFAVDTTGKRPVFVIQPEGQKSRQAEVAPMTPDFAAFLLATPEAERVGRVFPLPDPETGREIGRFRVMHVVGRIARKARVVVGETEKAVKVDGEVERRTVKMYATSHDLRRAFCTRWSRRVMPAVLQRLARHAHVGTTMAFYVASTAEEIGADLWAAWGAMGDKKPPIDNTSDNKAPANACGADDSGQGVANVTDYTTEGSAQAEDTSRP
jgi:integrase